VILVHPVGRGLPVSSTLSLSAMGIVCSVRSRPIPVVWYCLPPCSLELGMLS
jgi:hypothetical protein